MTRLVRVYKKKGYEIFAVRDGYIVYNTAKEFSQGHTHIKNINTAKYLVNLSLQQKVPKQLNDYLMDSLIRISKNPNYVFRLEKMRKSRKKAY